MEALASLLESWPYIATAATVYFGTLVFYRLFLHPLSKFPGPKLAAITRYYEAYFDVIQNGQYTFKIADMHKKYGPIIRISPYELHINDPAFFEQLYRQEGRWEKYAWAQNGFMVPDSTICSINHGVHRVRRQPLNAFFPKVRVASQQNLIRKNAQKLCDRISHFSGTKSSIDLGAAISACTRDIANAFILGNTYKNLDHEDFNASMTTLFQGSGSIWRITKHITWFGPAMKAIPPDWLAKIADEGTKLYLGYLREAERDTKRLLAAAVSEASDGETPTIVDAIVNSNRPPAEKSFNNVFDDVSTITGAGYETTASVLRLVLYHVFSDAEILHRLRTELASVGPLDTLDLRTLEQLPYLTSVLTEGLRLSPGIATRTARIAPDRDLIYDKWRIPSGTPVGMTALLMHMNEELYPDPKNFNPNRWMDPDFRKKGDKTYAPFSRGTRICLGMHLAWAEMYLVLAALVQQFNFKFECTDAKDFECIRDDFTPGTSGKAVLNAFVTPYKG